MKQQPATSAADAVATFRQWFGMSKGAVPASSAARWMGRRRGLRGPDGFAATEWADTQGLDTQWADTQWPDRSGELR